MSWLRKLAVLPLLLLVWHLPGQISTGTLSGTAKDASGGVVPGASVEVRNLGTNMRRATTTDAGGEWAITDLPAGHYEVKITLTGFKAYIQPDVELQVAQRASIDTSLEVGSAEQQVTVEAAAVPLLNGSTSAVGQVVESEIIDSVPLDGRSFWELTALTPGAAPQPVTQGTVGNGKDIRASFVSVTINGTSNIWTGWVLDGANITEPQLGGTLIQPNVDAIQEFKVEGANMAAEYGHTPTLINAQLKSGSNGFHGNLFEYVRNAKFDARNFFYFPPAGSNLKNEPLQRNQYGGTLGGPIRHNRTFFFVDLEETNIRQGQDNNSVVPSVALRGGTFGSTITDPLNRQPFPSNQIPAARIAAPSAFLLPYIPQPNFLQSGTSRAILITKLDIDTTKADLRLDHQLTANDQLTGHYSISNNSEADPNPFPALGSATLNSRAQNGVISESHVFNAKWINNARVSYYRSIFLFGAILQGTNIDAMAGITGFADTTSIQSFPSISISGYTGFTGSPSDQRPKSNRIRDFVYADTASYSTGKHEIKFGAELMHQTLGYFNGSSSVGNFSFQNPLSGNTFADFLLGYPYSVTRDYFKNLYGNIGNFWSFFGQDNIRLTQNFTLNVGLRLEMNPFYNGIRGQKAGFDVTTGKVVIPSNFDPTSQALSPTLLPLFRDRIETTGSLGLPESIQKTTHGLAPRIGFAWRPFGSNRWAVRSAYGVFYVFPDDNLINNTEGSVPFIASQTVFQDLAPAAPTHTFGDFFLGQPVVSPNPNTGVCAFGFAATSCATPNLYGGSIIAHDTYLQQWNLSMQRQFTASTSLDLAYVGNKSTHLNQNLSINDPLPGPGAIQGRRPYPQWGTISYPVFNENGDFNSFQTKVQVRNWQGLTLLASYAFSKCIDYGTGEGGTTVSLLHAFRGVCDYNQPHNFAGSVYYRLPFGKGAGWYRQAIRGWEMAGIVTVRSGLPFSATINNDGANTGVSGQRAQVIGTPVVPKNVNCWFYVTADKACTALVPNTAPAFAVPAQYTYGNGGRNILLAQTLEQANLSLHRIFRLSESKRLDFRGEFFNALNHPTFGKPDTNVNDSTGGQISSTTNAARVLQGALKFYF